MRLLRVLARIALALWSAWAAAALAIDGPFAGASAKVASVAWILACIAAMRLRPARLALAVVVLLDAGLTAWWVSIPARNDRDWMPEYARTVDVEFDGDLVRIDGVRDFRWRSDDDFDALWETRTYDLSKIRAVDIFVSRWGAPMIAHTIMSWEFEDGRHLPISIETRKEIGESYSAVLGFFRQFELYYVVSDERDVIAVRTNVRGEDVSVFRLSAPPSSARALLEDYLRTIQRLETHPDWYNALTHNCTTTIWRHVRHLSGNFAWDWRLLVNGSLDSLLYLRGSVDTSIPFDELRRRSDITEAAKSTGAGEDFPARIREGRPRMDGGK